MKADTHASELMDIGANKKMIQQQMSGSTGKRIIMKDLSKIENPYKTDHHETKNARTPSYDL